MSYDTTTKKSETRLRRWIAPGTRRIQEFAIQMDGSPEKGAVRINWHSFKSSRKVKEQIEAAAALNASQKATVAK